MEIVGYVSGATGRSRSIIDRLHDNFADNVAESACGYFLQTLVEWFDDRTSGGS